MPKKLKAEKTAKRTQAAAPPSGDRPTHFFKAQLAGEEPLTWQTAERLYKLSAEIYALKPWTLLADQDLFLVRDPASGQIGYCSVMGALGEVLSLYVYLGEESYRTFQRVAAGEQLAPEEFLTSQTGISIEFVTLSELTPPDRELLKWFGHPLKRGSRAPMFRTLRSGFHPWYVTEPEAIMLAECMAALMFLCAIRLSRPETSYWNQEDIYPMIVPVGINGERTYKIEMHEPGAPPPAPAPAPAPLDDARLRKVREKDYTMRGCFEVDCFYVPTMVGGKNDRKAFARLGLITESASGFVFKPELATAEKPVAQILLDSLLNAIDAARFIPAEVRVSSNEFKGLLDPVAQQLGISLHVMKSLPSLERARHSLMAMMLGM